MSLPTMLLLADDLPTGNEAAEIPWYVLVILGLAVVIGATVLLALLSVVFPRRRRRLFPQPYATRGRDTPISEDGRAEAARPWEGPASPESEVKRPSW